MKKVETLLKQLVNAQSTLDCGELDTAIVLKHFFEQHDIPADIDVWQENRANITAIIKGDGTRGSLLFACHSDVVPAGDAKWQSPPFQADERDGKIFGRGSCDMKAGLAAIAVAAVGIKDTGSRLRGDLIITSTAGEETDGCGVKKFVSEHKDKLPKLTGIILPEPTDFNIVTSHHGCCWLKIRTIGKTAHGSMPHHGINAITSMTAVLNKLNSYHLSGTAACSDASTISINKISGGKATNVIPDNCVIEVDIRMAAGITTEMVISDMNGILVELRTQNPDFNAEIEIIRTAPTLQTDPASKFVKSIGQIIGVNETRSEGYTSDGPYLKELDAPVIIFGPGKTELAHQPDEFIDIIDLNHAVEVYTQIIENFLM